MSLAQALFSPGSIALIGASADASRIAARAQLYLRAHGFRGTLYPVNPRHREVLGQPAFASLAELPGRVDFAYVLLPQPKVADAVAACAAAHVPVAGILADGFAEAGPEGQALEREIAFLARAGGVRLLGPNSMGMINVPGRIACSVSAALQAETLPHGGLSLVSQSGSMIGALISRAAARGIGFAKLISTGNEADLAAGEIAELLVDDPETRTILLFLETIRDPERMLRAAVRAHAKAKPVIVYRLGRSEAGARVAKSHTGALAGQARAADAFFRAAGIIRVDHLETLFEMPPLAAAGVPCRGKRRVSVVSTTGGGGAMVADRLGLLGIEVARMHDTTLAGARKDAVAEALSLARNDASVDLAIAVIGSSAEFRPHEAVAGVIAAEGKNPRIAFLAPAAGLSLKLLADAGIAAFRTPESLADAVAAWFEWQAPRPRPDLIDLCAARRRLGKATDEPGARAVFAALGLADRAIVIDPDAPPALSYPVALKAVVPGLWHKTEAGAVTLDIPDAAGLARAAGKMREKLGAGLRGFLAQPMARGVAEVLLGFRRDPAVGPVVVLGMGGILAEIYADRALALAPLSVPEAEELIGEVKGLAAARGFRGLPKGDLPALAQAVTLFSQLAGLETVAEAEINPLIVMREGEGVVMADALIRVAAAGQR